MPTTTPSTPRWCRSVRSRVTADALSDCLAPLSFFKTCFFFFKLISGECRPRDLCFTGLESCCKIGPLQLELGDMMDASFLDVPFESVAVIPSCRVSH